MPGQPVEVLGFDGVPEAGEHVRVVENERRARQLAGERANRLKTEALARRSGRKVSLEDVFKLAQEGTVKELALVVKADVAGLAGGDRGRDRQAPPAGGQGQHHPPRRRRDQRVRRDARRRLRGRDPRLQRAPRRRRPPGRRPRGRRDPLLLGDLPRDRRAARRDAGHARARPRSRRRSARPRSASCSKPRASARSRARSSPRASPARRAACASSARAPSSTTPRSKACAASTRTSREVSAGFECGIVLANFQDVHEGDLLETYETRKVERELSA